MTRLRISDGRGREPVIEAGIMEENRVSDLRDEADGIVWLVVASLKPAPR